jgi:hypothetical protein
MVEQLLHPASFRDPSGFVFRVKDAFFRQVNMGYAVDYEALISSGLYDSLTEKGLLIPHKEIGEDLTKSPDRYKTLYPEQLDLISYPYEWSAGQLRDAALLTLEVMGLAIEHGMILKDASPFNIQFHKGRPLFIDSLSFEKNDFSSPWIAYRQFCESFLFPLYLEHYHGAGLQKLLSIYPDGIPVAIAAKLLPARSRFSVGVWMHVHLQNLVKEPKGPSGRKISFDKQKLLRLVRHLKNIISRLSPVSKDHPGWTDYYRSTISGGGYLEEKEKIFRRFLEGIEFGSALDLGANEGYFSRILAEKNAMILAVDADHRCIDSLYGLIKKEKITNILPLCVDMVNPSPASGFRNRERSSFAERQQPDLVVALALIHHLVLGRHIPLPALAAYLAGSTREWLIIEFVPLTDEKAAALVRNKKVFHTPYTAAFFEESFSGYFSIPDQAAIPGTERRIYLMKKISL